ncbi:hypothetical protein BD410DRAFT_844525 [Rickenella mellea]|uniref:Uncharacterized protein n=1 Tax=Rickenella mellea TaxID=50990 RepID=A0A4Y7PPB3_9AGAM|nr:hypothetical protein BD410DRAFT_844525 [Rickenella mellea]
MATESSSTARTAAPQASVCEEYRGLVVVNLSEVGGRTPWRQHVAPLEPRQSDVLVAHFFTWRRLKNNIASTTRRRLPTDTLRVARAIVVPTNLTYRRTWSKDVRSGLVGLTGKDIHLKLPAMERTTEAFDDDKRVDGTAASRQRACACAAVEVGAARKADRRGGTKSSSTAAYGATDDGDGNGRRETAAPVWFG